VENVVIEVMRVLIIY